MEHLTKFGLAGAFRGWHEAILMNHDVSRRNSLVLDGGARTRQSLS
jgi:hypothetical protein